MISVHILDLHAYSLQIPSVLIYIYIYICVCVCVHTFSNIWQYQFPNTNPHICFDNDNDNENNFIVMNYIGTMTAVKMNTASRHLDNCMLNIGIVFRNNHDKGGMKPRLIGPNICLHYLLWGAGKRLMVTNYKLTHCGPAWQVSSRDIKILNTLVLPNAFTCGGYMQTSMG